jgi:hypothetical protein
MAIVAHETESIHGAADRQPIQHLNNAFSVLGVEEQKLTHVAALSPPVKKKSDYFTIVAAPS